MNPQIESTKIDEVLQMPFYTTADDAEIYYEIKGGPLIAFIHGHRGIAETLEHPV